MPKRKEPSGEIVAAMETPVDLDIFSPSFIQTAIKGEQIIEFFPISPLINTIRQQVIQFDVPETFGMFTDPAMLLVIKAQIKGTDGSTLTGDEVIAPVNLTLHAMFKDVVLKVNGVNVNQSNGTYNYRSIIETNFSYSPAAKQGAIGIPQMYIQETANRFATFVAGENPSFDQRKAKFAKSTIVEMAGRLHCDFLRQPRLIVPGVRFSLQLFPSTDSFVLYTNIATKTYQLDIHSAVLQVRRVHLSSNALLSLERAIQHRPAKYPILRATVRTYQLLRQQTQISNLVLQSGQLPRLVIITLVTSNSFQGDFTQNPFAFTLHSCQSAQLEANGQLYPPLPYKTDKSWIGKIRFLFFI